jgi:hypothetical protein
MERAMLQRKPQSIPPVVHDVLRESGRPLDPHTRDAMSGRLGHNFANVRIHDDRRADESAGAVGALAYTVGHHVVFRESQYRPETATGARLLAHELVHVVQQSSASAGAAPSEISETHDRGEREADAVTAHALHAPRR